MPKTRRVQQFRKDPACNAPRPSSHRAPSLQRRHGCTPQTGARPAQGVLLLLQQHDLVALRFHLQGNFKASVIVPNAPSLLILGLERSAGLKQGVGERPQYLCSAGQRALRRDVVPGHLVRSSLATRQVASNKLCEIGLCLSFGKPREQGSYVLAEGLTNKGGGSCGLKAT